MTSDSDQDALLYQVFLEGAGVCHTKNAKGLARRTCFYRKVDLSTHTLVFDPVETTKLVDFFFNQL